MAEHFFFFFGETKREQSSAFFAPTRFPIRFVARYPISALQIASFFHWNRRALHSAFDCCGDEEKRQHRICCSAAADAVVDSVVGVDVKDSAFAADEILPRFFAPRSLCRQRSRAQEHKNRPVCPHRGANWKEKSGEYWRKRAMLSFLLFFLLPSLLFF